MQPSLPFRTCPGPATDRSKKHAQLRFTRARSGVCATSRHDNGTGSTSLELAERRHGNEAVIDNRRTRIGFREPRACTRVGNQRGSHRGCIALVGVGGVAAMLVMARTVQLLAEMYKYPLLLIAGEETLLKPLKARPPMVAPV